MTPCYFLHGFLGAPSEWECIMRATDCAGDQYALALPLAPHWTAGLKRLAELLADECVLVGYSLGARVALGMTINYPSRVRGLCLISGNPGLEADQCAARQAADLNLADRLQQEPLAEFLDRWYRQDVFASLSLAKRREWVREKQEMHREYQANLLRCYSVSGQPNYWRELGTIVAPTVIIVGADDPKYVAIAHRMQNMVPQSQLYVVASAGHAVHREQPRAVAEIVGQFIAALHSEEPRHE